MFAAHTTTTAPVAPIPTVFPDQDVYQSASHDGTRALWIVFVLMVISSAVFALLSWNVPVSRRVFHTITTLTTIISAISYFAMASGHASTYNCTTHIDHHKHHVPDTYHDVCRQVLWARYVDWALTFPLILTELFLLAGIDGAHTLMAVVANVIMVLTGWFSALGHTHTAQKWGWYAISCVSFLFVIWHIAVQGTRVGSNRDNAVTKLFGSLAAFSAILWVVYLVVWGVSAGAKKTTVDTEIITYAVLDVLSKAIFGLWLIFASRKYRETSPEVGGYWTYGFATDGRIRIGQNGEEA
ncbi:hypothetical protein EDB81DRAFT_284595 [Dactylonectria macrodidyma]|uniref:Opsin-like protein carO n=1 Tax=Dactylonectria macrodidyma TaxID=307937 RepID=A0A9P9FPW7_9HYPO|nr:hypothetical protein EDB81DRAFT_284595 [Dactylonectria macrodidyma]